MKPNESAGCHQTLSSQVGSGDETTANAVCVSITWPEQWLAVKLSLFPIPVRSSIIYAETKNKLTDEDGIIY